MNSLRSKLIEQLVLIILSVRLLFTLHLSIFFQNFFGISQGPLKLFSGVTRLGRVSLIYNNGKTPVIRLNFFIDNRKFL